MYADMENDGLESEEAGGGVVIVGKGPYGRSNKVVGVELELTEQWPAYSPDTNGSISL